MRITRRGSERLIHAAFRLAMKRRKQVTLVDKANVLPSMVFFRAVFDEVAKDYPDVRTARTVCRRGGPVPRATAADV